MRGGEESTEEDKSGGRVCKHEAVVTLPRLSGRRAHLAHMSGSSQLYWFRSV